LHQRATLRSRCARSATDSCETCTQDLRRELDAPGCRAAVYAAMERASEDIRFSASLAQACVDDRNKLCSNVAPVRAARPFSVSCSTWCEA
jgi:Cysteine rich repeat